MSRVLLIGAAVAGVLLLAARPAQAAAVEAIPADQPAPDAAGWSLGDPWSLGGAFGLGDLGATWEAISQQQESHQVQQARQDAPDNVAAFLSAIAWAEGTERAADPYRVCYGYRHTIRDLSEHPAVSGEWKGEPLDNLGPRYAGKISTAAGRYQIIRPTWERARRALGLADFGPAAQDAAAVWLIRQRGALDAVQAGDLGRAVQLCRAEWASLPGSDAGQPQRRMDQLTAAFEAAGGVLA